MYIHRRWFTDTSEILRHTRALALACGQTLLRLHPLLERRLAVANGAADLDERRPIAAHARLGQPRGAHVEDLAGLDASEQRPDHRSRRTLRPLVRCLTGAFRVLENVTRGKHLTSLPCSSEPTRQMEGDCRGITRTRYDFCAVSARKACLRPSRVVGRKAFRTSSTTTS